VLPAVVELMAQALTLPSAAILLGESIRTAAAYGSLGGEPEALSLVCQREGIGRLVLSPRAPGEGFSDADLGLLEDLAQLRLQHLHQAADHKPGPGDHQASGV
jgi:hypothetical protein